MERAIIEFPSHSFSPIIEDWFINVRGRAANDSVTGVGQVVIGAQPRWEAKLEYNVFKGHRVALWRVIMSKLRGRVNLLRINACGPKKPTIAGLGIPTTPSDAGVPFDDGAFFSDGTGFAVKLPLVPVVASAAVGATRISIDGSVINNQVEPGMFFSIDDWLYQIVGVYGTGATTEIEFEMPLRRAVTTASKVDFDAPVLVAVETDFEGRVRVNARRFGNPTLSLIEWTNRP